jgi:hypothetical protein
VVHDPELGWLSFGGALETGGESVRVRPLDSARSCLYVAPLGLWLTLDAGQFESLELSGATLRVTLAPATPHTPLARLRIEQPAAAQGVGELRPSPAPPSERGAWVVPLGPGPTSFTLVAATTR